VEQCKIQDWKEKESAPEGPCWALGGADGSKHGLGNYRTVVAQTGLERAEWQPSESYRSSHW
jgi:hypothetical protein